MKESATHLLDTLGERLRTAREACPMKRARAAAMLGWSLTTLRSYEVDATSPNIADVVAMASLYNVDPVALAFGRPDDVAATLYVSQLNGQQFAVPTSLLEGIARPLAAVDVQTPALGVAIYQPVTMPPHAGGYAVLGGPKGARITWLWRAQERWWMQSAALEARLPLREGTVLGRLVAQLARVV
jgi:transcriptional regulator with XRE-family HTH domain